MHSSGDLDGAQPSPKRAKADSSQKLGALLLRGWTMRAESCPDCLVPLMSQAGVPDWLCVNCSTGFQPSSSGGVAPVAAAPALPAPGTPDKGRLLMQPASAHVVAGTEASEALTAEDEAAFAHAEQLRAALRSSAGLGDGLGEAAAGGVEAGDVLPPREQAVSSVAGDVYAALQRSAGLGGRDDAAADGGAGDVPDEHAARANGGGEAVRAGASRGGRVGMGLRDASAELAKRVLQGWTLTNEHCPRCQTPLVRSRAQELFCVGCQLRVRAVSSEAAEGGQNRIPQRLRPALQSPGAAAGRMATVQADAPGPPAAAPTPAGAGSASPALGAASCIADEVDACIACVLRRMASARTALDSQSANTEHCHQYLHVLRECALALAALRRI